MITGVRMAFYPAMAGPQITAQRYRAREAAGIATFKVRDSRSRGISPSGRGDALVCPPYRATRRSGGTRQFCRFALGVRASHILMLHPPTIARPNQMTVARAAHIFRPRGIGS